MLFRFSLVAVLALAVCPRSALALEGVPPFEWFVSGRLTPEFQAGISVRPEMGSSGGYTGADPERSLKMRNYLVAPLLVQYGLRGSLEVYGAFPFYWGTSPQRFAGEFFTPPEPFDGTVSGADFGDPALAVRWRAWQSDEERWTTVLAAGAILPLGSNVWREYPRFTYIRTSPDQPSLAVGDGTWKLLLALQELYETETFKVDALAGYILKFPLRATAIELSSLHKITVHQPSPLLAWVRPAWLVGEGLWLTGRLEGFWAPRGDIKTSPESIKPLLDSYANLVLASGGIWAGAGVRWELTPESALSLTATAPVVAHRSYRYWRIGASASYLWKP